MDINMEKITWRDKEIIRFLSALDTVRTSNHDIKCIVAIFLFGFYLLGGVFFNTIILDVTNGLLSKFTRSTAIWVVVFLITFLQMRSAYNVFLSTYQDALGPQMIVKKLQNWMRTGFAVVGLVAVKFIYLFIRRFPVFPILWFLCGFEILIRILAMYFLRESIDDLKQEIFVVRKATSSTKSISSTSQLKLNKKDIDESV